MKNNITIRECPQTEHNSNGCLCNIIKYYIEQAKWYGWRRWHIYCPKGNVSHLFERPDFQCSLFDYDEAFVSPCTLNEINCGGFHGKWTPKIKFIGIKNDGRFRDELC